MRYAGPSVGERILTQVTAHEHRLDDIYAPEELTQNGMSKALGKSRAHIALEAAKLVKANRLTCVYRVIRGSMVKQKSYVRPGHPNVAITERPADINVLMCELKRTNDRLDKVLAILSKGNTKG